MQIETGKLSRPRRTLLYGVEGIGKSTFFANAERPVFLSTEDGSGDIDCTRLMPRAGDPLCRSFDEVRSAIRWLGEETHDFQTLVIDSLDWLEKLIHADVCKVHKWEHIDEPNFQKGYDASLPYWSDLLTWLTYLRSSRGMAIGLIAHARIEKFKDPTTESYDRYAPGIHKHAAKLVQEWVDEVFFATVKVYVSKSDEGFGRKKTVGQGSDERIMFTTARPSYVAKNRLSLPHEMPLIYSTYAEHRNAALVP